MEDLVNNEFHASIEAKIQHVETLAGPLQRAAALITQSLVQDGKILVCGNGLATSVAETLAHCLVHGQRMERPGLPAVMLRLDPRNATAGADLYHQQVGTLGKAEDVLVAINADPVTDLGSALIAGKQCGLRIVLINTPGSETLSEILTDDDVELFVNTTDQFRIHELQLLSIFCLCDLIENNLFGGTT